MASNDSREEGITLRQRAKYFACFSFRSSLQPSITLLITKHLFESEKLIKLFSGYECSVMIE